MRTRSTSWIVVESSGSDTVANEPTSLAWSRTRLVGAAFLLLSVSEARATQASTTISGSADIVDGDTLDVGTTRVRLFGIDAPETAQECTDARGAKWACGRSAARALEKLTAGQSVFCRGESTDDYGRLLAVCTTPRGEVNAGLVRQGLAWAFVKYSQAYVAEEADAKVARRGVFAAHNEPPWEYRAHRWEKAITPRLLTGTARSRETSLGQVNGSTTCRGRAHTRRLL